MKKETLKKSWLAAAIASAAIISAIFLYALLVETISRLTPLKPPLTGAAAAAAKYALYLAGVGAVVSLRLIRPALQTRKDNAAEALAALVKEAVITAAICEVPAFAGLLLFFLAGCYWDFYLLASFSAALELYFFPRYQFWEEKIRNGYGLTL